MIFLGNPLLEKADDGAGNNEPSCGRNQRALLLKLLGLLLLGCGVLAPSVSPPQYGHGFLPVPPVEDPSYSPWRTPHLRSMEDCCGTFLVTSFTWNEMFSPPF